MNMFNDLVHDAVQSTTNYVNFALANPSVAASQVLRRGYFTYAAARILWKYSQVTDPAQYVNQIGRAWVIPAAQATGYPVLEDLAKTGVKIATAYASPWSWTVAHIEAVDIAAGAIADGLHQKVNNPILHELIDIGRAEAVYQNEAIMAGVRQGVNYATGAVSSGLSAATSSLSSLANKGSVGESRNSRTIVLEANLQVAKEARREARLEKQKDDRSSMVSKNRALFFKAKGDKDPEAPNAEYISPVEVGPLFYHIVGATL
jgi:hypothetical protein